MENKYSKKEFEGYTHRFIVEFETGDPHTHNLTLYSNSGNKEDLEKFINEKKSDKVKSFKIVHKATKEQDDHAAKFFDETLKGL